MFKFFRKTEQVQKTEKQQLKKRLKEYFFSSLFFPFYNNILKYQLKYAIIKHYFRL